MTRFVFHRRFPTLRRLAASLSALVVIHFAHVTTLEAQEMADPIAETGFVKEFGTMWTFDAPPMAYWKAAYDFAPEQGWLDHVRLSAVRIPGCSASIVSDRGLVMTNHHCARSCITAVSTDEMDYQETGFVAPRDEDELRCPGMTADQLQSTEDVTARVRGAVTGRNAEERVAQRRQEIGKIQDECSASTGLRCQVVTFYQGGMYSLYRYKQFDDLRLVMAPEGEVSFFGGDPDNFTYPRYDLDVTFLRIYENGQPMEAEHFLRWNAQGAKEGEVVFVVGNPGSTGRLLTLAQMEYLRDVQYPAQLELIEGRIGAYRSLSERSEEARRQFENNIFGLENARKAYTGYLSGLTDPEIMGRKKTFEDDFRGRIRAQRNLRSRYGSAWDAIAKAQAQLAASDRETRYQAFGNSMLLGLAGTLVMLPIQEALPEDRRLSTFRDDGIDRRRAQVIRDRPIDLETEKALLAAHFALIQANLPASDPVVRAALQGGNLTPEQAATRLVEGTGLSSLKTREAMVEGGGAAIEASDDPMIELARVIAPLVTRHGMRRARLNATISTNAELIGQAIFAAYGTALPPDATFTLRISDGVVKGFPMNGTIAPYRTSFYGLFGRNAEFDDKAPFHLPDRWKMALGRLDLATPVNFVSTADIIGGNSGSPLVNRRGEVVGVAFDGNIEMLPNRFIFTDEVSRTVSVHTAAITEALKKVYGAERVAAELERAAVR